MPPHGINLLLLLLISNLRFIVSNSAWDCSPVFDSCPSNGLVLALGPLENTPISLAYPNPLLQLPSLWSTKADFAISAWFRTLCPIDNQCSGASVSCWLDWNVPSSSADGVPFLSYRFDTYMNQMEVSFRFLTCHVAITLPGTVPYWTMLSISFEAIRDGAYSIKVWSNTSLVNDTSAIGISWPSRPTAVASVLFSSTNSMALASIFNLRVFDTGITNTNIASLFLQTPDSALNSAYVPQSNSRFYLAPGDPLRASRDMNSDSGRLLTQGPLLARFNVTHEFSHGTVSLSNFWLFMRINVDNAPSVTEDSYIPIYSIVFADGHFLTIWWERYIDDGNTQSRLYVVIALQGITPICPENKNVIRLGPSRITSPSDQPWHTLSVSGVLLTQLLTTLTFSVDSYSVSDIVDVDGFQPAVFMSTPDYDKITCKLAIPVADSFRIYLASIRYKNESSLVSSTSYQLSKISALDTVSFCTLGQNRDSVQFPPIPCSGHGSISSDKSTCACDPARIGPSCRTCVPGAIAFDSNTGDPFGQCICPVGHGLLPSQCSTCAPGRFNGLVNSNCSQCAPGTYSQSGSSKCDICPGGTYSDPAQTSCLNCSVGLYSAPKSSSCSPCPKGNVPTVERSSCHSCSPGSFANVTQCSYCSLGTASNIYNATTCPSCNPGQFANATGLLNCESCPMGRFSDVSGSTDCTPCRPGFDAQQTGSSACSPCDLGRFSNSFGNSQCDPCPRGTFTDQQRSMSCLPCDLGTYAPDSGTKLCLKCDPGRFANSTGLTQCNLCPKGYSAPDNGSVSCTVCQPGTFSNSSGSSTCMQCAPGKFSNVSGSTECLRCPIGTSAPNPGSKSCSLCNPGFFGNVSGLNHCSACAPGSFSNMSGATQCRLCSNGTSASSPGSVSCSPCQPGLVASGVGFSTCSPCTPGRFTNETGSIQCTLCPIGTYAMNPESDACSPCRPGSIAPNIGSFSCQPCDFGSVAKAGQGNCIECTAGTYADVAECTPCPETTISGIKADRCYLCPEGAISSPDGSHCLPCAAGRFVPFNTNLCLACALGAVSEQGKSSCQFCTAGTYANITTCSPCPSGFVSPDRAVSCTPCRNGTMPDETQAHCVECQPGSFSIDGLRCPPCTIGRFAPESGASHCRLCNTGSVAGIGASTCTQCTSGMGPNADNSTCVPCLAGWYSNNFTMDTCLTCPPGSYTLRQGQTACNICPIGRYSNDTARASECTACPLTSFTSSPGSIECQSCQANSAVLDPSNAISQASCLCRKGYFHNITASTIGFVCNACPEGFICNQSGTIEPLAVQAGYFVDIDDDRYVAFKCDPAEACLSSIGGSTKCAPLYTGFRCSSCINGVSYRLQQKCLQCQTNFLGIVLMAFTALGFCAAFLVFAKPSKTPLSAIGLCLSNVQLIAVFATSLTNNWTPEIQALWQIFSILNFNIELFRPECAVQMSFWTKQFLKLLLPVISFWILLILGSVYYLVRRVAFKSGSLSSMIDRVIFASNLVLLYGYTLLVSSAADAFNCEDAGRGQLFLKGEPSVSCISDEYKTNIISSYIAIAVYGLGIPVGYSALLWNRYRTKTLLSKSFINRFGELTNPYKPGFFFWEIVNMIRRLLIIITINLIKGKFAQLFLLLALLFLTLLLHSFFNPYQSLEENRLATLWNLVTILVLFSAAILDSSDTIIGPNEQERKALTTMVFIGLAWTVAYTLKCLITELEARKKMLMALVEKKAQNRPKARKKKSKARKSVDSGGAQKVNGLRNLVLSAESHPSAGTEYLFPSIESTRHFIIPHTDRQ